MVYIVLDQVVILRSYIIVVTPFQIDCYNLTAVRRLMPLMTCMFTKMFTNAWKLRNTWPLCLYRDLFHLSRMFNLVVRNFKVYVVTFLRFTLLPILDVKKISLLISSRFFYNFNTCFDICENKLVLLC